MIGEKDMGASGRIKIMLSVKKISIRDFAGIYGTPIQSMYNKLHRDAMSFEDVEKMADMLDFDIVFKDRKTGKEY